MALLALGLTLVVVGAAAKAWTAGAEGSMVAVMTLGYVTFLGIATAIATAVEGRPASEVPSDPSRPLG